MLRFPRADGNDVDLDKGGFIYITDRAGNGLYVLEYTGKNKPAPRNVFKPNPFHLDCMP